MIDIDDAAGNNNGRLDPGEYARLTFKVTNVGHYIAESPHFSLSNDENHIRVITPETTLDDLEVNDMATVAFDVYVEYSAGEASYIQLLLHSAINGIRLEQDLTCAIGFVMESFENGVFEPDYWTVDPVHPWQIVSSDYAPDGSSCAKSGTIDHSQTSTMTLTFTSTEPGQIMFFRRVSSEANYDFLYFYIDGAETERWSGEQWWARHAYATTPGRHSYQWTYSKDHSVNSGSDCAWIDYITLPPYLDETEEQATMPLSLHPNPTTDLVAIDMEGEGDFNVKVYDANGRLVVARRNATIVSFKGLSAGLYHIVVEQGGSRWSGRIVKM